MRHIDFKFYFAQISMNIILHGHKYHRIDFMFLITRLFQSFSPRFPWFGVERRIEKKKSILTLNRIKKFWLEDYLWRKSEEGRTKGYPLEEDLFLFIIQAPVLNHVQ